MSTLKFGAIEQTEDMIKESNAAKVAKDDVNGILELAERLDFLDVQILRKFYMTGKEFPLDTQPFCFPILFREMRTSHHLKIGIEALRKRLDNLVKLDLLEKIRLSNPSNYSPIRGKEQFVRAVIVKFFLINGLTKFI